MTCEFKSLLPHPTGVELALEQDAAEKYCRADPAVIRTLFDPMECPVEFLPWLAYALSVDVWNPQWSESTKRAICQNSLTMHLHKGTVGGMEDALAALGITAEITEWWQMEPQGERGTMTVMLWVNQNLLPNADVILGADVLRDVHDQINRSKRASIHYAYGVGVESQPASLGYGFSSEALTHHCAEVEHVNTSVRTEVTSLGYGCSSEVLTHHRAEVEHINTSVRTEVTSLGYGCSSEVLTHHRVEVEHVNTSVRSEATGLGYGFSAEILTYHQLAAYYDQLIITTECAELPVPFALSAHCTTLHRLEVSL